MTPVHREVLGLLYKKFYYYLCKYASASVSDWQTVENLVQRTFEIACKKDGVLDSDEEPLSWLIKILTYEIKNYWRAEQTRGKYFEELNPEVQIEDTNSENIFDNINYLKPSDVSDEDFDIVKSIVLYGYTYTEVAKQLGISESACYKRVQRAKERIKSKII